MTIEFIQNITNERLLAGASGRILKVSTGPIRPSYRCTETFDDMLAETVRQTVEMSLCRLWILTEGGVVLFNGWYDASGDDLDAFVARAVAACTVPGR